ncbi:hypothetical protein GMSM_15520 [Geomonas sp. Red276]
MTLLPAMMITVTFTTFVIMVPRMYIAWLNAEWMIEEEEVELMKVLLEMEQDWVKRHVGSAIAGVVVAIILSRFQDGDVSPSTLTRCVGIYATSALVLAVAESLIAQKIGHWLDEIPVKVKVRAK